MTEAMDIFSAGCVLAEMWMEGTAIFTLSQLFGYKEGSYDPSIYLQEIEDVDIRVSYLYSLLSNRESSLVHHVQAMIQSMISLSPASRRSAAYYLTSSFTPPGTTTATSPVFPDIFSNFLHPFLNALNTDEKSDDKLETVWNEWERIGKALDECRAPRVPTTKIDKVKLGLKAGDSNHKSRQGTMLFPLKLNLPGVEGQSAECDEASGQC